MKVAVIGSRSFKDADFLAEKLDELRWLLGDFVVISGGAPGADTLAEKWAASRGLSCEVYKADWENLDHVDVLRRQLWDGTWYDARAGFRRNQVVIDNTDQCVVAFWDGKSNGTKDAIQRATKAGKAVYVFWPGTETQVINPS
jgi:hypothetical protein